MPDRRPASHIPSRFWSFRTVVFWAHLSAGVTAGLVILVMCVTGALLTYERELVAWSDRGFRSAHRADRSRLPVGTVLSGLRESHPDLTPTAVTLAADPDAPVAIAARQQMFYVDAYSGALLGQGDNTVRGFMAAVRAWHRWLAVEGEGRPVARMITGCSNLIFLFIVISGFFLWFPRNWTWRQVRPVVFFKTNLRGKARDFNWHNTIGSWSAVPLFVVVLCALPISFPWANASVYRLMGDEPPRAAGERAAAQREGTSPRAAQTDRQDVGVAGDVIDTAWTKAAAQVADWKTITFRPPADPRAPLTFAIDRGDGGEPHLRSTLTFDRRGEVVRYETFSDQRPGARLRSITRFAHTGEILGLTGQTIAGIATAGGAVLVWTGLALAFRRLAASLRRRRAGAQAPAVEPAA